MGTVKLFEKGMEFKLDWDYDGEVDVLYLSLGEPRQATGIDIGEGVIVRYDEGQGEVVGLTILGIRNRLERFLQEKKIEKQGKP